MIVVFVIVIVIFIAIVIVTVITITPYYPLCSLLFCFSASSAE